MSLDLPLQMSTRLLKIEHKQSISAVIAGTKGDGKSYLLLSLGEQMSKILSKVFYQNENHAKEFFTIDNVAIMNPKDIRGLMSNSKSRYAIYGYDDIAYAWNSRDWASKGNKIMNAWFAFQRGYGNATITTIQSEKFQDSQSRALFQVLVEMSHDVDHDLFDKGVSLSKNFNILLKNRGSKMLHYKYQWVGGIQYDDMMSLRPSKALSDEYDRRRDIKMKEFSENAFKMLEEMENGKQAKDVKSDNASDQLRDWLHDNQWILEKQTNNKYFSSDYISKFFIKDSKVNISSSTARPIIKEVRGEFKAC